MSVTQSTISHIEDGRTSATRLVLPICRALEISPPKLHLDAFEARWDKLGQRLRSENPDLAERTLDLVTTILAVARSGGGKS